MTTSAFVSDCGDVLMWSSKGTKAISCYLLEMKVRVAFPPICYMSLRFKLVLRAFGDINVRLLKALCL